MAEGASWASSSACSAASSGAIPSPRRAGAPGPSGAPGRVAGVGGAARRRVRHERSAGGVVLVPLGQALLVALTVIREGQVLALPKGRIERGEEPHEAALREVREETGLTGALVAPLPESAYRFHSREWGARVSKRVAFYLMAYRAGSPRHHDGEVEAVRLVPLERAERLLAYPGERRVMAAACARLGVVSDVGAGHPAAAENSPAEP